jgi:hypothetical protein
VVATIEIKDLSDSIELDRNALSAIYGGSKTPLAAELNRQKTSQKSRKLLFFPDKGRYHLHR